MTHQIRVIIITVAIVSLPVGFVLIQRQLANAPAQPPVSKYLPIQQVSKQVAVEPDLESRKRKQFEETSRFFDSPGLPADSGVFSR